MSGNSSIEDTSMLEAMGVNVAKLQEHAAVARKRLDSATGSSAAMGSYPAGNAFASHHDAVARVMASTMQAMGTDIETFGNNIVASARSWRDGDDDRASCMRALGVSLSAPGSAGDTYDSSRSEQRDGLVDVRYDTDGSPSSGVSEQTTDMLREPGDDTSNPSQAAAESVSEGGLQY